MKYRIEQRLISELEGTLPAEVLQTSTAMSSLGDLPVRPDPADFGPASLYYHVSQFLKIKSSLSLSISLYTQTPSVLFCFSRES